MFWLHACGTKVSLLIVDGNFSNIVLVVVQSQEQVKLLEIRRALDAEGWLSDVTILRKQLAAVDRKLHQMRLMDRLQVPHFWNSLQTVNGFKWNGWQPVNGLQTVLAWLLSGQVWRWSACLNLVWYLGWSRLTTSMMRHTACQKLHIAWIKTHEVLERIMLPQELRACAMGLRYS